MIEKQDYVHKWHASMPDYYHTYLKGGVETFPDFTKRMAALRELFEECNLLIGKVQGPQAYSSRRGAGRDVEPMPETALALRDLYA